MGYEHRFTSKVACITSAYTHSSACVSLIPYTITEEKVPSRLKKRKHGLFWADS